MIIFILEFLFWVSLGFIVYTYILYPLILYIWFILKPHSGKQEMHFPTVAMIISAYNEEKVIEEKINNVKMMDYPSDRLEVLIGLDGCSDNTAGILKNLQSDGIRVFTYDQRRGKAAVLNDLVNNTKSEILVFSDANTMYKSDAVKQLVQHFNIQNIGGVCGKLELIPFNKSAGSVGESIYWRYENILKYLEGNIYTTIGATGAIYAIRRELFEPLPVDRNIADDFHIPLGVVALGYRVVYEQNARGFEKTTISIQNEFSRKVRIGIANFVGLNKIKHLLSPRWKFVAFALWSHKVIRWIVPLLMIIILLTNIGLLFAGTSPLYGVMFWLQMVFYGLTMLGFILDRMNIPSGFIGYPYFFVSMHLGLLLGFIKYIQNKRQPMWNVFR